MGTKQDIGIGIGSAAVFAVAVWILYKKAREAGAFDPTSDKNLAYGAVNSIGASITGNPNFNFGSWMFEMNPLNADALAAEAGNSASATPPGYVWVTLDNGTRTLLAKDDPRVAQYAANGPHDWGTMDARDYQAAQDRAANASRGGVGYGKMNGVIIDAEEV